VRPGLAVLLVLAVLTPGCTAESWARFSQLLGVNRQPGAAPAGPPVLPAEPWPPGRVVFTKGTGLWVWEDGKIWRLTDGYLDLQPAWSPDGRKLAFIRRDEEGYSDLVVLNLDTGRFQQLTRNSRPMAWAFRPAWSPDGRRILFLSERGSTFLQPWVINADGTGLRRLAVLGDAWGGVDRPSWSPDGAAVALAVYQQSHIPQVYILDPATGQAKPVTSEPGGAYDPAWSPDGGWVAFVKRTGKGHEIWLMRPDGSDPQPVITDGVSRSPVWSPDGHYLAFVSARGGTFDLWVVRLDFDFDGSPRVGSVRPLTQNFEVDPVGDLSWTR
jgi:Tol biopolymer transport system component